MLDGNELTAEKISGDKTIWNYGWKRYAFVKADCTQSMIKSFERLTCTPTLVLKSVFLVARIRGVYVLC